MWGGICFIAGVGRGDPHLEVRITGLLGDYICRIFKRVEPEGRLRVGDRSHISGKGLSLGGAFLWVQRFTYSFEWWSGRRNCQLVVMDLDAIPGRYGAELNSKVGSPGYLIGPGGSRSLNALV